MNLKNKIKIPKNLIVIERLVELEDQIIIPAHSRLYSGMTGRVLGEIKQNMNVGNGFTYQMLVSKTLGRNFTIRDKRYAIAETDDEGKVLDSGVLFIQNAQNGFMGLSDFLVDQSIEYQKTLNPFQRFFYGKKIDFVKIYYWLKFKLRKR